jgi:hypothetical protein
MQKLTALSPGERVSRSGAFTSRCGTGEGFLPPDLGLARTATHVPPSAEASKHTRWAGRYRAQRLAERVWQPEGERWVAHTCRRFLPGCMRPSGGSQTCQKAARLRHPPCMKCAKRLGVRQRSGAELPPCTRQKEGGSWRYRTPRRFAHFHGSEGSAFLCAPRRFCAGRRGERRSPQGRFRWVAHTSRRFLPGCMRPSDGSQTCQKAARLRHPPPPRPWLEVEH